MKIMPTTPIKQYDVHIVPVGKLWAVKPEHMPVYSLMANTQLEAIAHGMRLARNSAAMLVIHGRDGQFREVWNYA